MDANQCRSTCDLQRLSRTAFLHIPLPLSSKKQLNCWATLFALQISCCIGWALVWISYWTVRGALLCSCWLFAPCFSAIDSLQECSYNFKPKFVRIVTQNPNFLDRVEHVPGSRRSGKNPLFATSASQTHVSHIHFFYTLLLLLLQLWLNTHRKFQVQKVCLRPSQTPSFQRPNHDRMRFFVR
jgi:hypothetical protein